MLTTDFTATALRSGLRVTEAEITAALTDAFRGHPAPDTLTEDQVRDAQWALTAIVDEREMLRDKAYFGSW